MKTTDVPNRPNAHRPTPGPATHQVSILKLFKYYICLLFLGYTCKCIQSAIWWDDILSWFWFLPFSFRPSICKPSPCYSRSHIIILHSNTLHHHLKLPQDKINPPEVGIFYIISPFLMPFCVFSFDTRGNPTKFCVEVFSYVGDLCHSLFASFLDTLIYTHVYYLQHDGSTRYLTLFT